MLPHAEPFSLGFSSQVKMNWSMRSMEWCSFHNTADPVLVHCGEKCEECFCDSSVLVTWI